MSTARNPTAAGSKQGSLPGAGAKAPSGGHKSIYLDGFRSATPSNSERTWGPQAGVLHAAALGWLPGITDDPLTTNCPAVIPEFGARRNLQALLGAAQKNTQTINSQPEGF